MDFFSLMFSPFAHPALLTGGTLIFFVLGWLWYNPITPIGKIWIKYFPMPEKMPAPHQFIVMMLFQLLMGLIITHTVMTIWFILWGTYIHCWGMAVECPIWYNWNMWNIQNTLMIIKIFMGFVFIKDLGHWFFEKKPFPLVLIGVGYYLIGILGVCGLLSYFL